jgi:hypothetical protein
MRSRCYDATITRALNLPTQQMARLDIETVVLGGTGSWPGLRDASRALPEYLARAQYVDVPGGAGHGIPAEATAKALDAFLSA